MSKLVWDKVGERLYETGVDRGVLALLSNKGTYQPCVVWNGLTSVSESPSGAEANPFYADNIKYLNLLSAEDFAATIEAYTYPDEFNKCIGRLSPIPGLCLGNQKRSHFGFSYRTLLGNDINSNDYGYKLHLVFNCLASSSEQGNSTINDSPEPLTFSWEITTTTVTIEGYKPTATIVLNSRKFAEAGIANALWAIEDQLYGTGKNEPSFPSIQGILETIQQQMYLMDSSGNFILDSNGEQIRSFVYSR